MNRVRLAFLLAVTLASLSPQSTDAQSLEAAAFMEIWMTPAGGIMHGMARVVRTGRPASWESVLVHIADGTLVFSESPSGQPPADFTSAEATAPTLRFENRTHNVPQTIEYRPEGPDAGHARAFRAYQDVEPAFVVTFERAACPGLST